MRKKNVLIAIFFITIILLVPFTSLISAIDNKPINVTKEQENLSSIPNGFLFEDLRAIINNINLLFRNYPEVTEICNNITKILDARFHLILCVLFATIYFFLEPLYFSVDDILHNLGVNETLFALIIYYVFAYLLTYTWEFAEYFCDGFSSKVITGLSLINLKILSTALVRNDIINESSKHHFFSFIDCKSKFSRLLFPNFKLIPVI